MFCTYSKVELNVYAGFCGFSRGFGAKNRKHGLAVEKNLASLGYFTPSNKKVRTMGTKCKGH